MENFSEKIPQHRHCTVCGKAFIGDGYFCSDGCKNSAGKEAKGKLGKYMIVWVIIIVATIALLLVTGI